MCNFILPITYPATICVDTYVSKLGNSSVDFIHQFKNVEKNEKITAVGLATAVWVNLEKNKAIALPKSIKNKLIKA
jgi:acyl-CoA thioesterase FadM